MHKRDGATMHNPELNLNWISIYEKITRHFVLISQLLMLVFCCESNTRISWQFPVIIVTLKVLSITRKSPHSIFCIWGLTFEKESTDCMLHYYFKQDTIQTSTQIWAEIDKKIKNIGCHICEICLIQWSQTSIQPATKCSVMTYKVCK